MKTIHHMPGDIVVRTRQDPWQSWLTRQLQHWICRRVVGHCWHPGGFVDWWCCECDADRDGMPAQNCVYCKPKAATDGR